MIEYGVVVAVVGMAISGVVWGVRLEGRINGHDTLFVEREKRVEERHDDICRRLDRIEAKLDRRGGGNEDRRARLTN